MSSFWVQWPFNFLTDPVLLDLKKMLLQQNLYREEMDCLIGGWVAGGIERAHTGERMGFMAQKSWLVLFWCFWQSLFPTCDGHKTDRTEWNWCVELRLAKTDWERVGTQRNVIHLKYLIFTLYEEWMLSLMLFSSIHTNSSSSSSAHGTLHHPPSPSFCPPPPPNVLQIIRLLVSHKTYSQ